MSQILQNADIGWTASRGPITATGGQDVLSLATPLTGTLNVTGSLSAKATGAVGDALGSLLGGNVAETDRQREHQERSTPAPRSRATSSSPRGRSSPPTWRIEPNLAAQVNLGDTSLSVAGARVNVPGAGQAADRQERSPSRSRWCRRGCSNDPAFEQNARAAMGQGLPLDPAAGHAGRLVDAGAVAGTAARPARSRAQPRVDASAVTLTLGIEAETRITPAETKPTCPFPADHRHRAADAGTGRDRRADRHAVHRDQQDRRGAVRRTRLFRKTVPGSVDVTVKRASRRGVGRPAADFAAGQRQGEEELLRPRRRGQCAYLGQAGARSGAADACG